MEISQPGPITQLLIAHRDGVEGAFDEVIDVLYQDLRRLARRQRGRARRSATLGTTALVHEAYVKLANGQGLSWSDRVHFLGAAAQAMRHITVDYARSQLRAKRGGGAERVELEERHLLIESKLEEHLAVDAALEELREQDPRLVHVVECRYFAGMSLEETAVALGLSIRSVGRIWRQAKGELQHRLSGIRSQ